MKKVGKKSKQYINSELKNKIFRSKKKKKRRKKRKRQLFYTETLNFCMERKKEGRKRRKAKR